MTIKELQRSTFIILFLLLIFPRDIYAYLDPGSSSALISTFIAAVTAGIFIFKSFFYRIFGGIKQSEFECSVDTPVLFSEGKNYWRTFRPIINELIRKKVHFRYISLDLNDPGLTIESEFMHSRLYPSGLTAFSRIAQIKAPLMLSTTPNIGTEGYPMKRAASVKYLVHVFHAMSATANYRLGALDHYDAVIMIGKHEAAPLREIEAHRKIKRKELVALGLPYLDDLHHDVPVGECEQRDSKTVLVAPSWGRKGCFSEYGVGFVKKLVEYGFNVIIRLHPQSYLSEPDLVRQWRSELSRLDNLVWDTDALSLKSMHDSDILISDTSSVRFDYAFLFFKPVVTLTISKENRDEYESRYYKRLWSDEASHALGKVVDKRSIEDLSEIIHTTLADFSPEHLRRFRDESIANFGNSASFIVNYMKEKIAC